MSKARDAAIRRKAMSEIEESLDPAKGLGLLPVEIDGKSAMTRDRVRAAAVQLREWDRDVSELARLIAKSPKLRGEIRAGESAIRFAIRKLQESIST